MCRRFKYRLTHLFLGIFLLALLLAGFRAGCHRRIAQEFHPLEGVYYAESELTESPTNVGYAAVRRQPIYSLEPFDLVFEHTRRRWDFATREEEVVEPQQEWCRLESTSQAIVGYPEVVFVTAKFLENRIEVSDGNGQVTSKDLSSLSNVESQIGEWWAEQANVGMLRDGTGSETKWFRLATVCHDEETGQRYEMIDEFRVRIEVTVGTP